MRLALYVRSTDSSRSHMDTGTRERMAARNAAAAHVARLAAARSLDARTAAESSLDVRTAAASSLGYALMPLNVGDADDGFQ